MTQSAKERPTAQKLGLWILLACLLLIEAHLVIGFLPTAWQSGIQDKLFGSIPQSYDYSRITHPNLDHEINQAIDTMPGLRLSINLFFGLLLIGNGVRMSFVWKSLHRKSRL